VPVTTVGGGSWLTCRARAWRGPSAHTAHRGGGSRGGAGCCRRRLQLQLCQLQLQHRPPPAVARRPSARRCGHCRRFQWRHRIGGGGVGRLRRRLRWGGGLEWLLQLQLKLQTSFCCGRRARACGHNALSTRAARADTRKMRRPH